MLAETSIAVAPVLSIEIALFRGLGSKELPELNPRSGAWHELTAWTIDK
jgi:hypothetical protein